MGTKLKHWARGGFTYAQKPDRLHAFSGMTRAELLSRLAELERKETHYRERAEILREILDVKEDQQFITER